MISNSWSDILNEPLLELENLQFGWDKKHPSLLKINSFTLNKGERVLIQGHSGSGKSTLLGLIAGVIPAQQGQIRILGKNMMDLSPSNRDLFRADHMGFIFQMFNLLPYLTVLENVTLGLKFSSVKSSKLKQKSRSPEEEAQRLLSDLGLDPLVFLDRKVADLSMGQQQRVAAARAFIGSPELIIADEPSSALDPSSRESFLKLLFEEGQRSASSLLYVSHDADSSFRTLFDRVLGPQDFTSS